MPGPSRMANANERKRKLDEFFRRLEAQEDNLAGLVPRVDRLEQRIEAAEAYRYVRVENSTTLSELWTAMEAEGAPRGELRQRAEQGLNQELKTVFGLELDEGTLKTKSDTLSNNKRTWPVKVARDTTAENFNLGNLVEWVSKAGSGFTLRLRPGEPSRLCFQQIKETINWTLFVIKQVQVDNGSNATLQIFPDRGPWQRAQAQNKGQGGKGQKGKGRGRAGKGKGGGKGKGHK